MRSDEEILKGFLEGDAEAFRELLIRFQPAFIKKLSLHHAGLWSQRAEILDAAETRLFEWRRKHLQGEQRFHPGESIQGLAWRIAKQEAELEGAFVERDQRIKEWAEETRPARQRPQRADDGVRYGELLEHIDALPAEMSEVLTAEAERTEHGGPPLDEALGISAAAARKRLERARRELRERLGAFQTADDEHKYSNMDESQEGEDDDDGTER